MKPVQKIELQEIAPIEGNLRGKENMERQWQIKGTNYVIGKPMKFFVDLLNSLSERVSDLEDRIDQKG